MELFRFRPLLRAVGSNETKSELESQSIFFSHPENLNDPMEGYRDIFWRGDKIAWENLIKNYIDCLLYSLLLYYSKVEYKASHRVFSFIIKGEELNSELFNNISKILKEKILPRPAIEKLINHLNDRTTAARADELWSHLDKIHTEVLKIVAHEVRMESGNKNQQAELEIESVLEEIKFPMHDMINKIEDHQRVSSIFANARHMQTFKRVKETDLSEIENERLGFIVNFPDYFIRALEDLCYPEWYTACFMSDYSNSSAWGHYAENHKGVCLIFESTEFNEQQSIELLLPKSIGPTGISYEYQKSALHKIEYIPKYCEIDFFQSLGRLTLSQIEKRWLKDNNGNSSSILLGMLEDQENWRTNYWNKFISEITKKTSDWSYENEYRVILSNNFFDFTPPESRSIKYKSSALKGIIFGINTPNREKRVIFDIIKNNNENYKNNSFEFYQAYYDNKTGRINRLRIK